MACCIVAAYLLALFKAKLRQWAVFVGLVRAGEHDDPDTIWRRAFRPRPMAVAVDRRER